MAVSPGYGENNYKPWKADEGRETLLRTEAAA